MQWLKKVTGKKGNRAQIQGYRPWWQSNDWQQLPLKAHELHTRRKGVGTTDAPQLVIGTNWRSSQGEVLEGSSVDSMILVIE